MKSTHSFGRRVIASTTGVTTGTHETQIVPGGIEIVSLTESTTSLSADDVGWYVQVGLACAGNTHLCAVQNVRPGRPPLVATLTQEHLMIPRTF